ncbi:MAG: tetratricopeptide repeat protein [Alphaproteobacteria bacterium]|nr:tetratricopeptide repeat protein [Alphaproteobacteria bacterium]
MIYLLSVLIITLSLALVGLYIQQIKRKVIYTIIEKHFLAQTNTASWYSSSVIQSISQQLSKLHRSKILHILNTLNQSNIPLLSALDKQTVQNINLILGKRKKALYHVQKAELALLNFDYEKLEKLLNNNLPLSKEETIRINYLKAHLHLKEGDLETASVLASSAAACFHKIGYLYEEALCFMLNSNIYRACGIIDTSQLMLQTALKIFKNLKAISKQAECYGMLGMLMITDNRFSEADSYFNNALSLFQNQNDPNGYASIINQQSLCALISHNFNRAIKLAKKAKQIYSQQQNPQGLAFSYDILAQSSFAANSPNTALTYSRKAAELYQQNKNFSAYLEMLQLQSQIFIAKTNFSDSEKILRNIISLANSQNSCFHVANAYNLLGIIYLKQKDYQRAEGIFQQALQAELHNERWCGAAIDYANIAITSLNRGNIQQSKKYWQMALRYAEQSCDNQLLELLQKQRLNSTLCQS